MWFITDVGCCCSLFEGCVFGVFSFVIRYRSKLSVFICFFFFVFFFLPLSLYPPFLLFLSLSSPSLLTFPTNLFFYFFFFLFIYLFLFFFLSSSSSFSLLFSLSLVLVCQVWLSKRVYYIKLIINIKKKY